MDLTSKVSVMVSVKIKTHSLKTINLGENYLNRMFLV